jgi:hypothetical protein
MTEQPLADVQALIDANNPEFGDLEQDEYINVLLTPYDMVEPLGLRGMGQAQQPLKIKPPKPVAPPQTVSIPQTPPIKTSTMVLVGGLAAVLVMGAIGFFIWRKSE